MRIDELPDGAASELVRPGVRVAAAAAAGRPDGLRRLPYPAKVHASSRSHIYLAVDVETDALVTLKIPSIDLRGDPAYLKRFTWRNGPRGVSTARMS